MAAAVQQISQTPARTLGRRVLAAAVAASGAAHLMVLAAIQHGPMWTVLLAGMSLWCLRCAWCVWRGGKLMQLQLMCAAMGIAHVVMVLGLPWLGDHHGAHAAQHGAHQMLMLVMALGEFLLMFWAAVLLRRSQPTPGT